MECNWIGIKGGTPALTDPSHPEIMSKKKIRIFTKKEIQDTSPVSDNFQ